MIGQILSEFAKDLGFTVTDSYAYGIFDGYFMTLYETSAKKSVFINYLPENDDSNSDNSLNDFALSSAIKNEINDKAISDYKIEENGVEITSEASLASFRVLIENITQVLEENGYKGAEYCSSCGCELANKTKKRVHISEKNYLFCAECALNELEEHNKYYEELIPPATKGNIKKGILGSLLFNALGMLLFVLAFTFLIPENNIWEDFKPGYFVVWFSAVMTFASYYAYGKFAKSYASPCFIVSSLITGVMLVITQYFATVFNYIRFNFVSLEQFNIAGKYAFQLPFVDSSIGQAFYKYLLLDLAFAIFALIILTLKTDKKVSKPELFIENL